MDWIGCLSFLIPGVAIALIASPWPLARVLGAIVGGAYFLMLIWGAIFSDVRDDIGRGSDPTDRF